MLPRTFAALVRNVLPLTSRFRAGSRAAAGPPRWSHEPRDQMHHVVGPLVNLGVQRSKLFGSINRPPLTHDLPHVRARTCRERFVGGHWGLSDNNALEVRQRPRLHRARRTPRRHELLASGSAGLAQEGPARTCSWLHRDDPPIQILDPCHINVKVGAVGNTPTHFAISRVIRVGRARRIELDCRFNTTLVVSSVIHRARTPGLPIQSRVEMSFSWVSMFWKTPLFRSCV